MCKIMRNRYFLAFQSKNGTVPNFFHMKESDWKIVKGRLNQIFLLKKKSCPYLAWGSELILKP